MPSPQHTLRRLTRSALATRAGEAALRAVSPDVVSIFLWHSVGRVAAPFFDRAGIAAGTSSHCSLDAFSRHVGWIRSRFRIVSLAEALERLRAGERGYGWIAALTFDDGFRSTAEEALPWLDAEGLPSTVFVNAASASGHWVKDRDLELLALSRLGPGPGGRPRDAAESLAALGMSRAAVAHESRAYAGWDQLRRLPASVSFGNHGDRHERLSALDPADAVREIEDGLAALRRELQVGTVPYAFAFGQPDDITDAARASALASHSAVLSAYGGFSWPGCGLGDVPRVPVFSSGEPKLLTEYAFPPRFLVRRAAARARG
ncbi:MAG TPA: polysaccharide deacetylase family protein [Vicinamibacterales bacterium]